jgi:hypothetical protein
MFSTLQNDAQFDRGRFARALELFAPTLAPASAR